MHSSIGSNGYGGNRGHSYGIRNYPSKKSGLGKDHFLRGLDADNSNY